MKFNNYQKSLIGDIKDDIKTKRTEYIHFKYISDDGGKWQKYIDECEDKIDLLTRILNESEKK